MRARGGDAFEQIVLERVELRRAWLTLPVTARLLVAQIAAHRVTRQAHLTRYLPYRRSPSCQYLDFHCLLLSQHRRQKAAILSQVGQVYVGGWVSFTSALTISH